MPAIKNKAKRCSNQLNFPKQLLLIIGLLFFSIYSFSQDLSQKLSVNFKEISIGDFIKYIESNSNIRFAYNAQTIPVDQIIKVKAKNKSAKEILDKVFVENGISYALVENQVILKMKPVIEFEIAEETKTAQKFTISGYLKDKSTGEVLIGASVYNKNNFEGTTTNAYGFYSLTLPKGNYDMGFSFLGYNLMSQNIDLQSDKKISIELEPAKFEIKTIEISGQESDSNIRDSKISEIKLIPSILKDLPGFAGSIDIVKSLQAIPGIKSYGDGSSLFYVRGGNSDQNLLIVDDAPIFNPSHLFGFFSALSPEAIKNIETYKGDFPANFGDRLSSVIDIRTKDGNSKKVSLSGSFGPYTSDLTFEGPIIKDKFGFFLSGRRSNINWLTVSKVKSVDMDINFYDINAKLNYQVNNNNRFFLTIYKGNDAFFRSNTVTENTFGINWSNSLNVLRWNHIFSDKLFSNTTLYSSSYDYFLYISKERNDYWKSAISTGAFKTDFTYFLNSSNTVKAGLEIGSLETVPGIVNFKDQNVQQKTPLVSDYHSKNLSLYLSNDQIINSRFTLRVGIRIPMWRNIGETRMYLFDENHQLTDSLYPGDKEVYSSFVTADPRLSLKYFLNEFSFIKTGYSKTTQFIQLISNSTSPFTSLEVWIPSGPNIKPQRADQLTLGYFAQLFHSRILFSAEGFYKKLDNQIDYEDHANLLFNPLFEGELRFGTARSYGGELMIRKDKGRFSGWLAYTYSRSLKTINGVNESKEFPAFYDRPHDICLNLAYKAGWRWAFSANFIYMTGAAVTTPIGFYYYNGYSVPIYGDKNNDRLPDYHRLDISATLKLSKPERKYQHNIVFNVYNVYGRKNPISVNFNKITDDNGNFVVPANLDGENERVPTLISVAGIIPSVTYNFKF